MWPVRRLDHPAPADFRLQSERLIGAECCKSCRVMMMISARIAGSQNCHALITGESVGQVASQTMYALACTDCAADMPVFRPCIGMDKDEIIAISRKIDTFEDLCWAEDCF